MYEELGISKKVQEMAIEVEKEIEPIFKKIDENCMKSSSKILKAFLASFNFSSISSFFALLPFLSNHSFNLSTSSISSHNKYLFI